MCAEKVHKLMIAILLGFNMMFVALGSLKLAFIVQFILIMAFIIWAFTGICTSLAILRKILPPCDKEKKEN